MPFQLSEEQENLLKELERLQTPITFRSASQIGHSKSEIPSQIMGQAQPSPMLNISIQHDQEYEGLKKELNSLKQQSQKIYKLSEFLRDDQERFQGLLQKKGKLVEIIGELQGQTSSFVQKQRKLIDLSVGIKESLHHYEYIDKFQFEWPCEIAQRQIFEEILVTTLSELTQGIQFFQNKNTYHSASKYLQNYTQARVKVAGFVKSFLIKLLNKEHNFTIKHQSNNKLASILTGFYPKSKIEFVSAFLRGFPQFKSILREILSITKQKALEQQVNKLNDCQVQIQQFLLIEGNVSLIKYLQLNMREIFEQVILKFMAYYRSDFHESMIRNYKATVADESFEIYFKKTLYFSTYLLSAQYFYLCYASRPDVEALQFINNLLKSVTQFHLRMLLRGIKDSKKNKQPFKICQLIHGFRDEYNSFLEKSNNEQYCNYIFGKISYSLSQSLRGSGIQISRIQENLSSLVTRLLNRIVQELQVICQHSLPKFTVVNNETPTVEFVSKFVQVVPNLQYCPNIAEKYLISSLDAIVKSIKECNQKMESRFYCYAWNIQIYSAINSALSQVKFDIVSKQFQIDLNKTSTIFNKVTQIDRQKGFLKYAQDLFTAIKTGMPTINQLTLDFSKYIRQHYGELQQRFLKDITFIYGKNIIEFLQRLAELQQQESAQQKIKEICKEETIKSLYTGYTLSLEAYIKKSKEVIEQVPHFQNQNRQNYILKTLVDTVYENLFQLLSDFYIEVSRHTKLTEQFEDIEVLRKKYKRLWSQEEIKGEQA